MKDEVCKGMLCYKDSSVNKIGLKEVSLFHLNEFRLMYPNRPLLLSEFGRITWRSFHRLCAYFSPRPSEKERELMRKMFTGFAHFFPCQNCKEDFVEQMKESPIITTNNIELSKWFIGQHNKVNQKMKKDVIDCNVDDFMASYLI